METLGKKKCKQPLARKKKKKKLCNPFFFFFLIRHHLTYRLVHVKLNKILINPNKLSAHDTTQSS